jgi:phosphatidylserine/phosphatidylglycerophosphate/cardiolipin synthase-like enzyme
MRRILVYVFLLLFAPGAVGVVCAVDTKPAQPPTIEVFFSPHGGCQDAIVQEIGEAKESVHVQAYSFTSAPIAKALLDAKGRGVKVEVIIDAGRIKENYSEATFFTNQGIPTWADGKHAIAHNKVMVIDGKTVITGSFNFTKAAEESNAENVLILRLPDIAAKYEKNYQDHLAHSVKYEGKAAEQPAPPAPQAAPAVAPQQQPASDPTVYVTTSGKKYHADGCRYLAKSKIPLKLSEAKAKGYSPCSVCGPPQ